MEKEKYMILIFNGYYTPAKNYGGPLTSCKNVVNTCSSDFSFYVVARNHDVGSTKVFENLHEGWNMVDGAMVKYISDDECNIRGKIAIDLINEIQPSIIWFAGILTPQIKLAAILASRHKNVSIIISPRGEVCADRISIKAWKKKPYLWLTKILGFYKNVWFHATCEEEVIGLKKYVGAENNQIFLVPNVAMPLSADRIDYVKLKGKLRVVFIARVHPIKNVKLAVEAIKGMISDVQFDIYGPLEQPEYWSECMKIVEEAPDNVKINYCGQLTPSEVGSYFRKYDCFLFPTINENYGHSIAESLANGVPVVLSKNTTPWSGIDGVAGYECALDSIFDFTSALERLASMSAEEYLLLQKSTREYYKKVSESDNAVLGHINMFNKVIENRKNRK